MKPTLDQLLQQSNEHRNQIERIAKLPNERLTRKPNEKSWCVLEVIDHLSKVYEIYQPNFEKVLAQSTVLDNGHEVTYKNSLLGRLAIAGNKPKGKKRRFKMKTFDFFEPSLESKELVIAEFFKKKEAFNYLLKEARTKDVSKVKMPTALGEKYKLYVPECFAFVLAHEARHLVQIEELLTD